MEPPAPEPMPGIRMVLTPDIKQNQDKQTELSNELTTLMASWQQDLQAQPAIPARITPDFVTQESQRRMAMSTKQRQVITLLFQLHGLALKDVRYAEMCCLDALSENHTLKQENQALRQQLANSTEVHATLPTPLDP